MRVGGVYPGIGIVDFGDALYRTVYCRDIVVDHIAPFMHIALFDLAFQQR